MYSEIVRSPQFYLDPKGEFFPEATTFILSGEHLDYLIKVFNSDLAASLFKKFYAGGFLGDEGFRYKKAFFEKFPVPKFEETEVQLKLIEAEDETEIEQLVGKLFDLGVIAGLTDNPLGRASLGTFSAMTL